MSKAIGFVFIFMGGFVTAMNIVILIGHNPNYDASYWKVAVCLVLAAWGAGMMLTRKEKEQ